MKTEQKIAAAFEKMYKTFDSIGNEINQSLKTLQERKGEYDKAAELHRKLCAEAPARQEEAAQEVVRVLKAVGRADRSVIYRGFLYRVTESGSLNKTPLAGPLLVLDGENLLAIDPPGDDKENGDDAVPDA